jgi:hypothetical protein
MDTVIHGMILATGVDDIYNVRDIHSGESYNYLVREIVRDKESGGQHNLYRADGINSYDPVIGKLFREKKMWEGLMEKNRGTMDKTIASIEAASKSPGEKGYKAARNTDIVRWQDETVKLQEEYVEFRVNSARLLPSIEDCKYNRLIEEMTRRNMRALRDKFFHDRDEAFLEKGVVWALKYAEKSRIDINFAALSFD